jgi:hypothetical protein
VQIQDHVEPVFFAPDDTVLDSLKTVLAVRKVFAENQFIVNRDPDVVESPALHSFEVVSSDKVVVSFLTVVTLRKPAAEIDTMFITGKFQDFFSFIKPWMTKADTD